MSARSSKSRVVGRAAGVSPPNRFERVRLEEDLEQLDGEQLPDVGRVPTEFLTDESRTVISSNDSPDVPFRYSINPYRGCEHGCAYCYARPSHELLGMNAGLDFESRILVKHDIVERLRVELADERWQGDLIAISGVTDCYQPAERRFRLTRGCLELMLEARQPMGIVTKNALVTRDVDVLAQLAEQNLVHVFVSITTLDAESGADDGAAHGHAGRSAARDRNAVESRRADRRNDLADHSGLERPGDSRDSPGGPSRRAHSASYILLRLPLAVRPIFEEWITRSYPDKAPRVLGLIRQTRSGRMNEAQFGRRMRGSGQYAEGIENTFQVFRRKHGLAGPLPPLDHSQFRPPRQTSGQMRLF